MVCPSCQSYSRSMVLDSRPIDEGRCVRRRRICDGCRHKWTTYEREGAETSFTLVQGDRQIEVEISS